MYICKKFASNGIIFIKSIAIWKKCANIFLALKQTEC